MAKLGCSVPVCVFIFFHLLQLLSFGVGDVLEAPAFNIDQQSLLKYLSLGDTKIDLPALYVFGDSYVDSGNNQFLGYQQLSNYLPFGVDFDGKPTGRATNGRLVVDFIATVAGFQYPPPIMGMSEENKKTIRTGVNYGSGGSGILPENGLIFNMTRLNFFQQVDMFENATLKNLKTSFGSAESFTQYLSKSVFFIHVGSNDLAFTYDQINSKKYPNTDKYAEILVEELSKQLKRLYTLGVRKFLVNNVSPLGCQPFNVDQTPNKTCKEDVNERISKFNKVLSESLPKLQSTLAESKFVLVDLYKIFQDVYASPESYGFKDVKTSCCVADKTCEKDVAPCEDRKTRVFFDQFHPSENMNFIWARRLLKDSSVCSPNINLIQLIQA